jgi:hypothetical protein
MVRHVTVSGPSMLRWVSVRSRRDIGAISFFVLLLPLGVRWAP